MAIAISSERQGYLSGNQGIIRGSLPMERSETQHPFFQRAKDALHAIHDLPRRHEIRMAKSHQKMALQDLGDFASIFQDPSCTIRFQTARKDGLVRFGIYSSTLTGYQKVGDVHVQPPTVNRGTEVTISSPMLGTVDGNVSAILTLSQKSSDGSLEVKQQGLVSHEGRKRIEYSRYETSFSSILGSTDSQYRENYANSLYAIFGRLSVIGNEAITAHKYDPPSLKAAMSLFRLVKTSLPDIGRTSGIHVAIPLVKKEQQQTDGLSRSQIQTIQRLHEQGLAGAYNLREHPSPAILGAVMVPAKDHAHYIVTTAKNTFFGTVLDNAPENYLPRYRDGRIEMVHKEAPSGPGIAMTAASEVMDMQTAVRLQNIGAKLRQEAYDKKVLHNTDLSLGRIRVTPPPMRAVKPVHTEPAQAAAYALFAPAEEYHPANLRISFDSEERIEHSGERQTPHILASDFSLPPVPRPTDHSLMQPSREPHTPPPFSLTEATSYLATHSDPAPIISFQRHQQKKSVADTPIPMLVEPHVFKAALRERFRTIGDAPQFSAVAYQPNEPLTAAQVLARRPHVIRPLEEHRRPLRSSAYQLA